MFSNIQNAINVSLGALLRYTLISFSDIYKNCDPAAYTYAGFTKPLF